MVLFSGKVLGEAFSSTEAEDTIDLCSKLFPNTDWWTDYRMWIETATATGTTFWLDVGLCTQNAGLFNYAMENYLRGASEVNIIIRGSKENSPNTSPDATPEKASGTPPGKEHAQRTPEQATVMTAMSNLTESTAGICLAPSKTFETYGAVNEVEPFTLVDITKASEDNSTMNLIPLSFPKIQKRRVVLNNAVVLVDLESLERFVETQIQTGKSPLDLCLKDVQCRGGRTKDFPLTAHVWIGSILPRSRAFRFLFTTAAYAESCRTAQLKELKDQAPRLYDHVLFWIDDMLNFDDAQWRVEAPIEATGVSSFMSPYYFTEQEARYLGNFYIEGSTKTLKDALDALAEEEVCTKTDLAPLIQRTFKVQKGFQKKGDYKEQREAWMKQALVVHENA